MANIITVDYEDIPRQAGQMRTNGQELNTEIKNAYINVTNMHENWYGKRYNELASEFNKIIPQVKDLLELVVGEIPFVLETVANNYAQADTGAKVTAATKTEPETIESIPTPNDVGMKCITNQVEQVQQAVSTNFKNAVEKMNVIESVYSKITWQSEASEAFKTKFLKLKKDIIASFENLNTQFSKLMNQAVQDINETEKTNTVS